MVDTGSSALAKRLLNERDALLLAHYAGAVPLEQLWTEQERISTALANAERELGNHKASREQLHAGLNGALNLLRDSGVFYTRGSGAS